MYQTIPFWPFTLGVLVAAVPLLILKSPASWRYVLLVLALFLVWNYRGVERFSTFIRSELSRR